MYKILWDQVEFTVFQHICLRNEPKSNQNLKSWWRRIV